jgi:tRNA threonylcarbamoyl adenosine modification protein (Sua5/YciO/YrdC/YwlC family)
MLIKLYDTNPSQTQLAHIIESLRNGAVIIYPTDTTYAIGCDLMQIKAIQRIVQIKGKKNAVKLSLVCKDISEAAKYSNPIDNTVFKMMRDVLPGPFTFILEANNLVPKLFFEKKKTVGVRIPDNNITLAIVEMLGNPLVSSSIDYPLDEPEYATDVELIYENYGSVVDLVIDAGDGGTELSTIIDCTDNSLKITRRGKGFDLVSDMSIEISE